MALDKTEIISKILDSYEEITITDEREDLVIDYSKKGCFQCLFTDRNGGLINNKVNKNSDVEVYKIRNGCGGTRVAYGNAVLLRTTAVLLDVIRKVFEMPESLNKLIDITPISVMDMEDMFVERKCGCCGDENNK